MATALTVRLLLTRFYINRLTTKNTVLYFQLKIQTKDLWQSLDRLRAAPSFRRSPSRDPKNDKKEKMLGAARNSKCEAPISARRADVISLPKITF